MTTLQARSMAGSRGTPRVPALVLALVGLSGLVAMALPPAPAARLATPAETSEYKVKALQLSHFFAYMRWPKDAFDKADSPLVLLIAGEDPFEKWVDEAMRGKKVGERSITVLRAKDLEGLDEWPRVHMVFLAGSHAKQIDKLTEALGGKPVVIVGDTEGLAGQGAQVNFYIESKRIGFEVNTDAVKRSRVEISAQLLKLARIVRDDPKPKEPR